MTTRRATILHVCQPPEAGVPRYVADVVPRLAARGWTVHVAAPAASIVHRATEASPVQTHAWEAGRDPGPSTAGEIAALQRIIRRVEPDVVHLHSAKAGLCGRLVIRGRRPTVYQPHAWSFEAVDGAIRRAVAAWERIGARWTSAIVCVSEAEREAGSRAGVDGTWCDIPNGVDLDLWTIASEADRAAARVELADADGGPIAVCVGRLSRQKGHDVLLEAWRFVQKQVPDARLFLVGDGPDRAALQEGAPASVRFVGASEQVDSWLAAADVVVLPSRWEGMSLAMLEAMARGRSVVTTDVAGAREAVGGGAGVVVPVENAAALGRAVTERLRDPLLTQREGREGRARVETVYNLDRVVGSIDSLYLELASRGQA